MPSFTWITQHCGCVLDIESQGENEQATFSLLSAILCEAHMKLEGDTLLDVVLTESRALEVEKKVLLEANISNREMVDEIVHDDGTVTYELKKEAYPTFDEIKESKVWQADSLV